MNTTSDLSDLSPYTIPASVDYVNIHMPIVGIGLQTITVYITADTNLEAVFDEAYKGFGVGTGILPSDLRDNYYSWYYKLNNDGSYSPIVLNVNVEAYTVIGSVAAVTKTEDIFSTGAEDEFQNTAYYINSNATLSELDTYVLSGTAGANIHYVDTDGKNQNLDIQTNVAGKSLKDILVENSIAITDLRLNYSEWFKDENDKPVLISLNVKEKTILPDAPEVIETDDLYRTSGSIDYQYSSYLIKSDATDADLDLILLADDVGFLNVYTDIDDGDGNTIRYDLTGVAGKTLEVALSAEGNDQNIEVDIDALRLNYREWFKTLRIHGSL